MKKHIEHQHKEKSSENLLDKSRIIKHLSVSPGQTVLDAGCGNGYMAREFGKCVGDDGTVLALDPDKNAIDILRLETVEMNIEPFVGDITKQTKLPASSIDLLYLSTVLHGFSKTQMRGFIKETKRLLKPGGTLAIVELIKEETPFGPPLNIRLSPKELRQELGLVPAGCFEIGEYFYLHLFKQQKADDPV